MGNAGAVGDVRFRRNHVTMQKAKDTASRAQSAALCAITHPNPNLDAACRGSDEKLRS